MKAVLKEFALATDKVGRIRWSEGSSRIGAQSRREMCLLLWIGCGQQSRQLTGKQEAEAPGVGGSWPFSCKQSVVATRTLIESFITCSGV